jgi:hypothetical protein
MPEVDPTLRNWKQIAVGAWLLGVVALFVRQVMLALIAYLGG